MKPKVAFFDFAGCEGDQLQIANLEEEILTLLGQVEIVSFREVMKEHSDNYDIAFVEGSCTRLQDEDRLKQIRKNAKLVVAIGSCACTGMPSGSRNDFKDEQINERIAWYLSHFDYSDKVRKLEEVITVDDKVDGCPMSVEVFLEVLTKYLKIYELV